MRATLPILLLFLFCSGTNAQTWTGNVDGNWSLPGNWNPAAVPGNASSVTIPSALGTYPTLTANVTIGALNMASGSALHLNGFTLNGNGNVTMSTATVDGGGSFSIVGPTSTNIGSCTFTTTLTIRRYTGAFSFLNNTVTGNTVLADSSTQTSSANYIGGNLFTGDLTLGHASVGDIMYESYLGNTGNHVTGNATYNITGGGTFYSSYTQASQIDGNLTVIRTVAGYTSLFHDGGTPGSVGGNFVLTSPGGSTYINQNSTVTVPIGGTINITTTAGLFNMIRIKNGIAGGTISVANASNLIMRQDTLLATMSATGYTGLCNITDNSIVGNTTISSAVSQSSSNNYISGNLFTGNLTLTHASNTDPLLEGFTGSTGNHVTGNAIYNLTGTGAFYSGYAYPSITDGNLTINRTAPGLTDLFQNGTSPGSVGGNFTLTLPAGSGTTYINNNSSVVLAIGGTINITSPSTGIFNMRRVKNSIAGGTVSVAGSNNVILIADSFMANVNITNYTGLCNILDNSFTGNTVISSAASQNSSNNSIDGNRFNGNLTLTHASNTDPMYESYSSPSGNGNRVTGNAIYNLTGTGSFYSGYTHPSIIDGNLTINRTAVGLTDLFQNGTNPGSVGGNFSLSLPSGAGSTYINNNSSIMLPIAGTVNITGTSPGLFNMRWVKNNTPGGSVSISGSNNVMLRYDTLLADINFTGYTSLCNIFDNSFTGNTALSSAVSQNSSNNSIDGNLFNGNLALTHASNSDPLYEGYGSNSGNGNRVTGNGTFLVVDSGSFYTGYSHPLRVDGNLTITRTVAGFTDLFQNGTNPGSVGGNFSLTMQSTGGSTYINNNSSTTFLIGGTININSPSTGLFNMRRVKNNTIGGSVVITNPSNVILLADTLLAAVSVSGYTGLCTIYDNSITGNTSIADAPSQNSGINYVDGNLFNGNLKLVHNSTTDIMYDGYGSPSGHTNVVRGVDSIVRSAGAAGLSLSYTHSHRADSTLVFNLGAGIDINSVTFGGSTQSPLRTVGGVPVTIQNLFMTKTGAGRLILDVTPTITGNMTFTSGYVTSTASNPLKFANGATHSSAGNASHVTGPVVKAGTQAFTFPLGNAIAYSPCGITAPATANDTFRAQYFHVPPHSAGYDSGLHDASINHISRVEYWTIDRLAGATNVRLTLGYSSINSGGVTNMSQLTVAHWYGGPGSWHDEGNSLTTGNNSVGTVRSNAFVSTFSPFTLASLTSANPLPVNLVSFDARNAGHEAHITWETAEEENISGFTVERSRDGKLFSSIGTVKASGSGNIYNLYDREPMPGNNYYRLAIAEADGSISYSVVKKLLFSDGKGTVSLYPNPANDVLYIQELASWRGGTVTVRNISGQAIHSTFLSGQDVLSLNVSSWPAGIYTVDIRNGAEGLQRTFVRE